MPVLIHLNGPPGVGKSTLAQRYVDEHPGALRLDIDTVASLIGGWREDFYGVLAAARNIAIAMAETHLRTGSDVVMPQLETSLDEADRFRLAADRAGADYVEVALTVGPAEQRSRFAGKASYTEVDAHIDRVVAAEGAEDLHRLVRRQLDAYIPRRPTTLILDTAGADVSESYAQLLQILDSR
jgi:predicted kinase